MFARNKRMEANMKGIKIAIIIGILAAAGISLKLLSSKNRDTSIITHKEKEVSQPAQQSNMAPKNDIKKDIKTVPNIENKEKDNDTMDTIPSGKDISKKNQEYGEKLSNPNLSQEERIQIIKEKKEYNRNAHKGYRR